MAGHIIVAVPLLCVCVCVLRMWAKERCVCVCVYLFCRSAVVEEELILYGPLQALSFLQCATDGLSDPLSLTAAATHQTDDD